MWGAYPTGSVPTGTILEEGRMGLDNNCPPGCCGGGCEICPDCVSTADAYTVPSTGFTWVDCLVFNFPVTANRSAECEWIGLYSGGHVVIIYTFNFPPIHIVVEFRHATLGLAAQYKGLVAGCPTAPAVCTNILDNCTGSPSSITVTPLAPFCP